MSIRRQQIQVRLVRDTPDFEAVAECGITYGDLYKVCRAEFLVSSDNVLRRQLVEYYDHDLLQNRRGTNGQEYLVIPIDKASLQSFLQKPEN